MAIDVKTVRHVAHLARLELSQAEEEQFAAQLTSVLGYIEQLSSVDVSQVEPLSFAGDVEPHQAHALLREDKPVQSLPREDALAAAPQQDGQSFLVPRIIE